MDSIEVSNPHLRNGPSCQRFQSTIQISIDWSLHKLPAIANVVAEVLTLQAYSPSKHHDYIIDLTTSDIRRGRLNRRKFVIRTSIRVFNIFCNSNEEADVWAAILAHSSSRRFGDYYRLGEQIADGRHSKVYVAYADDDRRTRYVVKVNNRSAESNGFLNRSQFERDAHLLLIRNFDVRKSTSQREKEIDVEERKHQEFKLKLSIEKLITLQDCFGTPAEDFLVFPYQDGEILSTVISKDGPLSERDARIVMWDLLTAVHFMHEHGLVHRDVRASNVFWNRGGNPQAKLFDLSEARQIPDNISGEEPFRDNPGIGQYKALEILSGRYHGKPADIWSCGVLLYKMLSGTFPFQGKNDRELRETFIDNVLQSSLFEAPVWDSVSPEVILLIKQMLQPDPFKRPSALGARSHQWLSNENSFRQAHFGGRLGSGPCLSRKKKVPQRLETPVTMTSRRTTRLSSTCDLSVLPATLSPPNFEDCVEEREAGRLRGEVDVKAQAERGDGLECKLRMEGGTKRSPDGVSPGDDLSPTSEETGDQNSKSSSEDKIHDAGAGDEEEPSPSLLQKLIGSRSLLAVSLTQTMKLERYEKMATAVVGKLTKLQATLKDYATRKSCESDDNVSSDTDLDLDIPECDTKSANTKELKRTATPPVEEVVPLTRKFPDRERKPQPHRENISSATRDDGLAHRCNHLCSFRSCTRSRLMTRADKLLLSRSSSKYRRSRSPSVTTGDPGRLTSAAPDLAICVRQQKRAGSASEIVPVTRCLDDEVFQWAKKTKLFSDLTLKRAPADPLYFCRGSSSTEKDARTKEKNLLQTSSRWQHAVAPVPLRDELCVDTHIMKSVVAAAHVGLSEFSMSRPVAAKLLLRSPTAQLQLSMILPYRRKFRTAGMALMAMFRIISLKKGSCLTRRIARGQPLSAELLTLLTNIRLKCHMRPLRARMPTKILPPDEFTEVGWRKERVEPRPRINATPQKFWSRQYEVKKGLVAKAWSFVKSQVNKVGDGLRVGDSHETDSKDSGENEHAGKKSPAAKFCTKIRSTLHQIAADEVDDFTYALNMV